MKGVLEFPNLNDYRLILSAIMPRIVLQEMRQWREPNLTEAYNMKEIGEYFQVHSVTVSCAAKNFEKDNIICTM